MALTADEVVIIGKGRLIAQMPIGELLAHGSQRLVRVQSPQLDALRTALDVKGAATTLDDDGSLLVRGLEASAIGDVAASLPATLHELATQSASLEDAFMELTEESVEYHGTGIGTAEPATGEHP
jgi:ABC-2 type transport system ATP-binding protein